MPMSKDSEPQNTKLNQPAPTTKMTPEEIQACLSAAGAPEQDAPPSVR